MTQHNLTLKLRSGVTLIEVLLVVVISVFMVTLALGGITNRGRSQFDDSMNQVLNNLRRVQNEAASGKGPLCKGGTADCLNSGDEIFGRSVTMDLATPGYYEHTLHTWGQTNAAVGQLNSSMQWRKFPSSLRLINIEAIGAPANTIIEANTAKLTKGVIVFARSVTAANDNSRVGNVALPFFFNQAGFNDTTAKEEYGFKVIARVAHYAAPQPTVVRLKFENPRNTSMKATIVINAVTGAMELES